MTFAVTDDTTLLATPLSTEGQPPPAGAYVAVLEGAPPQVIDLPPYVPLAIGRSRTAGVFVDHPSVSRLHATLTWDGGHRITVRDHGSRNGTSIEGQRVDGEVVVHSNARIRVGSVTLLVAATGIRAHRSHEDSDRMVATGPRMRALLAEIARAAQTDSTVLILGETGTGKELVAKRIHYESARASEPLLAVNCGAIPEPMAESTLFGHERGAFTGATMTRAGIFEAAGGGTVFLDEVAELSLAHQARLLRLLESRELLRVGGTTAISISARVFAATHRDLGDLVERGEFRADLLYRLDVLRVVVPPLRERPEDIEPLALSFLREIGGDKRRYADGVLDVLRARQWPGNVRELRNAIERAIALCDRQTVEVADFQFDEAPASSGLQSRLDRAEREAIERALEASGGNQTRAAKLLGLTRRALIYRMERVGLKQHPKSRGHGSRGDT
jgi:transcriptional regulator with PAS, ATPase and Fis domain